MIKSNKLFISDERMLHLMEWAIQQDDKKLPETQGAYLELIGVRAGNIGGLKNGVRGFTNEQILAAAKLTGVNINWLFGLEKNMFREDKKQSPLDMLKSAVMAVEKELQPQKRS